MLNAALLYAARGWQVSHHQPMRKQHIGYYFDTTTDPWKLKEWWQQEPEANVGIATGFCSRVLVIDVDGVEGMTFWEKEMGGIDYTSVVLTHRGIHLHYQCDEPTPTFNLHPQIDVLADDAQAHMPPSIHPSGLPYVWATGRMPDHLPEMTPQLRCAIERVRCVTTTPAA